MIDIGQRVNAFARQFQRGDGGILNGAINRAVTVGVQLLKGADNRGIAYRKAKAPSGHQEAFRHGIHLDAPLFSAGLRQQADRPILAVAANRGVGKVMQQRQMIAFGKFQRGLKQGRRRHRAGRIVRVIKHQQAAATGDILGNPAEVRQETATFIQWNTVKIGLRLPGR